MGSFSPTMHKGSDFFQAIIPGTTQKVAYTAAAAASAVIAAGVTIVRVVSSTDCYIKFGAAPTATSSDIFLPANVVEYFGVDGSGLTKISAIRSSADGNIFITEGAA